MIYIKSIPLERFFLSSRFTKHLSRMCCGIMTSSGLFTIMIWHTYELWTCVHLKVVKENIVRVRIWIPTILWAVYHSNWIFPLLICYGCQPLWFKLVSCELVRPLALVAEEISPTKGMKWLYGLHVIQMHGVPISAMRNSWKKVHDIITC